MIKLVDAKGIREWFSYPSERVRLADLIQRLIVASFNNPTNSIKYNRFPSGGTGEMSGYDGYLDSLEVEDKDTHGSNYIPNGKSVWELKTGQNALEGLISDFRTRSKSEEPHFKEQHTFVAICSEIIEINKKAKWINDRNEEHIWKNVILYDAIDIEYWLSLCPSVSYWFAWKANIVSKGDIDIESYWKNFDRRQVNRPRKTGS